MIIFGINRSGVFGRGIVRERDCSGEGLFGRGIVRERDCSGEGLFGRGI
jgi:hypothetical protein